MMEVDDQLETNIAEIAENTTNESLGLPTKKDQGEASFIPGRKALEVTEDGKASVDIKTASPSPSAPTRSEDHTARIRERIESLEDDNSDGSKSVRVNVSHLWREWVRQQVIKVRGKGHVFEQKAKSTEVNADGHQRTTLIQQLLKSVSRRKTNTIDIFGGDVEPSKLTDQLRSHLLKITNKIAFWKGNKHSESSASVCTDSEVSSPELPDRGYLEDIDFVVSEFDMILCTAPELPARGYLEDTEFLERESDVLFQQQQKHVHHNKQKNSSQEASIDGRSTISTQNPHHQVQGEDGHPQWQSATASPTSLSNLECGPHKHLSPSQQDPCSCYDRSEAVNPMQLPLPLSPSAHSIVTDSSRGHYQPLLPSGLDTTKPYETLTTVTVDNRNSATGCSMESTDIPSQTLQAPRHYPSATRLNSTSNPSLNVQCWTQQGTKVRSNNYVITGKNCDCFGSQTMSTSPPSRKSSNKLSSSEVDKDYIYMLPLFPSERSDM